MAPSDSTLIKILLGALVLLALLLIVGRLIGPPPPVAPLPSATGTAPRVLTTDEKEQIRRSLYFASTSPALPFGLTDQSSPAEIEEVKSAVVKSLEQESPPILGLEEQQAILRTLNNP